jgi:hypothetical protein
LTDEYFPGSGHPIAVDPTGKTGKDDPDAYDDNRHGLAIVMCPLDCHNTEVFVKDYARHLEEEHNMKIDPVQDRLMKSSAMVKPTIRKSKYVWAPFPTDIPRTVYEMHEEEMRNEK